MGRRWYKFRFGKRSWRMLVGLKKGDFFLSSSSFEVTWFWVMIKFSWLEVSLEIASSIRSMLDFERVDSAIDAQ